MNKIHIFTAVCCEPNPGKGTYAYILKTKINGQDYVKEYASGAYFHTTCNRMDLIAIREALRDVKSDYSKITIITSNKLISDPFNNGMIEDDLNKPNSERKNLDLWSDILEITSKHSVYFKWLGKNIDVPERNRCKELATCSLLQEPTLTDDVAEGSRHISHIVETEQEIEREWNRQQF